MSALSEGEEALKTLAEIQKKLGSIEVEEGDHVTQDIVDVLTALTEHLQALDDAGMGRPDAPAGGEKP